MKKLAGVALVALAIAAGVAVRRKPARAPPSPPLAAGPVEGFRFTDVTAQYGIHFTDQPPVLDPAIRGKERLLFWGAGVAVADVDGDGFMDIFLPAARAGEANHLYLNKGGERFEEAAGAWGVAQTFEGSATVSATFFDYDNDGRPDLFLAGLGCSRLFHNTGKSFEDVTARSGISDCANSYMGVPVDYDNDGKLDLYLIRYWHPESLFHLRTPLIMPPDYGNAKNGGRKTLYRNQGDGTFKDVSSEAGGDDTGWTLDAAAGDFTGTGREQIYLANDFGPDVLYSIEGGKLRWDSDKLGPPDRRYGMSASLGDLAHDGKPHLFVSNEFVDGYDQTGNFLWRFDGNGARDEAAERGLDRCGWAWGSLFADFDLDGEEDLYVANGFITARNANAADESKDLYADARRKEYAFRAGTVMASSGSLAMDVRTWPPVRPDENYEGHQIDCVFHNEHGRFRNVSPAQPAIREWDGRGVAGIDLENDGTIDLIVTTQEGPPHLFKTEVPRGRHWLGVKLTGTRSNRDAAGAVLELTQAGRRQVRWATAGKSGFAAVSDPRLHFGLPGAEPVELTVRWPSGIVQRETGVAIDRYLELVEPAAR